MLILRPNDASADDYNGEMTITPRVASGDPGVNLALAGTAQSSSRHNSGHDANKLIDGLFIGQYHTGPEDGVDGGTAQTQYEWVDIDLGSVQEIGTINIWNSYHGAVEQRIEGMEVMISTTAFDQTARDLNNLNNAKSKAVWTYNIDDNYLNPSNTRNEAKIIIPVDEGTTGRYIRFQKTATPLASNGSITPVINIAEIEIMSAGDTYADFILSAGGTSIAATGGTGIYADVRYNTSGVKADITGLPAGNYTLTFTNPANLCEGTMDFQIRDDFSYVPTINTVLIQAAVVDNTHCTIPNGSVQAFSDDPANPYITSPSYPSSGGGHQHRNLYLQMGIYHPSFQSNCG